MGLLSCTHAWKLIVIFLLDGPLGEFSLPTSSNVLLCVCVCVCLSVCVIAKHPLLEVVETSGQIVAPNKTTQWHNFNFFFLFNNFFQQKVFILSTTFTNFKKRLWKAYIWFFFSSIIFFSQYDFQR